MRSGSIKDPRAFPDSEEIGLCKSARGHHESFRFPLKGAANNACGNHGIKRKPAVTK